MAVRVFHKQPQQKGNGNAKEHKGKAVQHNKTNGTWANAAYEIYIYKDAYEAHNQLGSHTKNKGEGQHGQANVQVAPGA